MKVNIISDRQVIDWSHEGDKYRVLIRRAEEPDNPRAFGNLALMACWHPRYSLGDRFICDKTPEIFWRRQVSKNVPSEDALRVAKEGKLPGIFADDIFGDLRVWTKSTEGIDIWWNLVTERLTAQNFLSYMLDDLSVSDCMTLLEPYANWMPLWLYDHSGLSVSCGARSGQFADRWDSSQLGWIFVLKKDLPQNTGNWRAASFDIMHEEVEAYNNYLTGDVYSFYLYKKASPETKSVWRPLDSGCYYYGCDIVKSGMMADIGYGLKEALEAKACGIFEVAEGEEDTWLQD